jgi:hypothetical protein
LSAVTHQLGLIVETSSTALWKWWKLKRGPIKSYVEGEKYNIRFKFKNLGSHDYPGGNSRMMIQWPSGTLVVVWPITIPRLKIGEDGYAQFDENGKTILSGEVISSGYGAVSCIDVKSKDNGNVAITDLSGKIPYHGVVIHSIPARTWVDLYAKYSMIVCVEEGVSSPEFYKALNVALIVGGSITIPHIRRAVERLDECERVRKIS